MFRKHTILMMSRFLIVLVVISLTMASPNNGIAKPTTAGDHPPGSYIKTCINIVRYTVTANSLEAKCKTMNGEWLHASMSYPDYCEADISNLDGGLVCGNHTYFPAGSYQQTCQLGTYSDRLYAKCRRINGEWKFTSIDTTRCNGDIWNNDGRLTC